MSALHKEDSWSSLSTDLKKSEKREVFPEEETSEVEGSVLSTQLSTTGYLEDHKPTPVYPTKVALLLS